MFWPQNHANDQNSAPNLVAAPEFLAIPRYPSLFLGGLPSIPRNSSVAYHQLLGGLPSTPRNSSVFLGIPEWPAINSSAFLGIPRHSSVFLGGKPMQNVCLHEYTRIPEQLLIDGFLDRLCLENGPNKPIWP